MELVECKGANEHYCNDAEVGSAYSAVSVLVVRQDEPEWLTVDVEVKHSLIAGGHASLLLFHQGLTPYGD